jgi:hypothetical protein
MPFLPNDNSAARTPLLPMSSPMAVFPAMVTLLPCLAWSAMALTGVFGSLSPFLKPNRAMG